jgi:hypothetical protein
MERELPERKALGFCYKDLNPAIRNSMMILEQERDILNHLRHQVQVLTSPPSIIKKGKME